MFGPVWEVDGLHVTSMYHWFVPGPERRLDLVRPAGDAVTMSVILRIKLWQSSNLTVINKKYLTELEPL